MKKTIILLSVLLACIPCTAAREYEKGPFTVTQITENVYNIQDANGSNPKGMHTDNSGKITGMNNCSDIYLIRGRDKVLLIDLSNPIDWYNDPGDILREIVSELTGARQLIITLTHRHGDHLGMLPAFRDDSLARFWLPRAEFRDSQLFPSTRTDFFEEGASMDLGELIVDPFTVPGHTPGSTVFFLRGMNMAFVGDAIGSGNGLWLLDDASFGNFREGFRLLTRYITESENGIDREILALYGGHSWQAGSKMYLGKQYLDDMQVLLDRMSSGVAETVPNETFVPYLNTNFVYGSAIVTWNRDAAERYVEESRFPPHKNFTGNGPTHREDNTALLQLLKTCTYQGPDPVVEAMEYYLYDPVAQGADPGKNYPLIVVFHGASNGMEGIMCASYTDFLVYADKKYQEMTGGAYLLFPKANEYMENAGATQVIKGTWMTRDEQTGSSVYIPAVASLVEQVIQNHNIDRERVVTGGTSAGGYMTWRLMAARPDLMKAAFLIAPADNPSEEELKMFERYGIHIWVIHGKKDEICPYGVFTGPVRTMLEATKNVRVTALENVRYEDKGIVRMHVRGMEMGQHLPIFCVGSNMIYDDGTPYDPRYPEGFAGWLNIVFGND